MKNGRLIKGLLLTVSGLSAGFLLIAYADTLTDTASGNTNTTSTTTQSSSTNTQAYDALTQAQADAVAASAIADEENKGDDFLKRIAVNTYAFLKAFNSYSLNWLQIYNTPTSNELDTMFGNYIYTSQGNFKSQLGFVASQSGSVYSLDDPSRGIYAIPVPGADINYATLVKQNEKDSSGKLAPVPDETKKYAMVYVKNASAVNIPHTAPSDIRGSNIDEEELKKYRAFYNTTNSIASYNAYILSEHLTDIQNNFSLTQIQMDLKNYASNNDWLKHVNEEQSVGVLLRQMLLFTSQMYIISLESLETQKKILDASVMTNSLIIASSGFYEKTLLDKVKS